MDVWRTVHDSECLHCYVRFPEAANSLPLLCLALFADLGMVLTLANVLHFALQLPTAALALVLQKWTQMVLWAGLSVLLAINMWLADFDCVPIGGFMVECLALYTFLTVGTFSYFWGV